MNTTNQPPFGVMNEHAVGIVMKEMVRRAIEVIRAQRFIFEAKIKQGHSGEMDDLVTSADSEAQKVYVKLIGECFPGYGIIAEEDNLRVASRLFGKEGYFTIDPLDGTKAFGRKQSTGIGTMLALVIDGEIRAAYVGDIMTQEIFGYRPNTDHVYRISEYGHAERLEITGHIPLSQQVILLNKNPLRFDDETLWFMNKDFRDIEIGHGSIGVLMARLWKREVAAVLLKPEFATPWDDTPIK